MRAVWSEEKMEESIIIVAVKKHQCFFGNGACNEKLIESPSI